MFHGFDYLAKLDLTISNFMAFMFSLFRFIRFDMNLGIYFDTRDMFTFLFYIYFYTNGIFYIFCEIWGMFFCMFYILFKFIEIFSLFLLLIFFNS